MPKKTPTTKKFSTKKIAGAVAEAVSNNPGQHAWALAEIVGIPAAFFKRSKGQGNRADNLIRAALRSAERAGVVQPVKDESNGRVLWFSATKSVSK